MTQLSTDADFLEYYQFEHDPFIGRGSSFKFFAAKRRSVLVELHHLARYSKLMLVVTGPQGSGKTVLRQALVASSKEPVKSIVITAALNADAASMLQQVSAALGLAHAEIADVLQHIEQLLITGQEVHLIVDNAECLDESAFLFLQRIAQGINDASARVFVFSDSVICPLLKKVADNADLHHVIGLEAWDPSEVNEYLAQRLAAAGQDLEVFTDAQLVQIYTESKGWAGQINQVAKRILLEQMEPAQSKRQARSSIPFKYLTAAGVLAGLLLLAWFMPSLLKDNKQSASQIEATLSVPLPVEKTVIVNSDKTVTLALPLDVPLEPVVREPMAQALASEPEEQESGHELSMSAPVVEQLGSETVEVIPAPVPVSTPPNPSAEIITERKVPSVPLAAKTAPAHPSVTVTQPAQVDSSEALQTRADHQWYMQQAKARYTLQVLGTRSESTAKAFVAQDRAQYHYFRKQHQGQPLYVVTFGSFADRAAAQAAINRLPDKVRQDKPWPRTILSIQQELR